MYVIKCTLDIYKKHPTDLSFKGFEILYEVLLYYIYIDIYGEAFYLDIDLIGLKDFGLSCVILSAFCINIILNALYSVVCFFT